MPKGVICGGAVEGSNQLGEIVTCQAMTTCPDGSGPAAVTERAVPHTKTAIKSEPVNAKRERSFSNRTTRSFLLLPFVSSGDEASGCGPKPLAVFVAAVADQPHQIA